MLFGWMVQLPVGASDAELEERIIQHLAAAAAMGRAHHMARREAHRTSRTSSHARPHPRYPGFSAQPTRPITTHDHDASVETPTIGGTPLGTVHEEPTAPSPSSSVLATTESPLVSPIVPARPHQTPSPERSGNQDRAGPSESPSFSDFKTRVNAISMRYKESITKTTKSWKERIFSRNNSATDDGSKDRGEGSAGIATLSRMMDHLQQDSGHVDTTTSPPSDHRIHNTNNSASRNEITGSQSAPGLGIE